MSYMSELDREMRQFDDMIRKARLKYGDKEQMLKAVEEMSELTVELMNWVLNDGNPKVHLDLFKRIIDEIADVQIMMAQMGAIFGDEYVAARRVEKIERFALMLLK